MLMEKVTKELRRGSAPASPIRPTSPIEAAQAAPARPASAPTLPPSRAITREAAESRPPEPVTSAAETLDYGREIELPDEIPPSAPRETVTVAASSAPVAPPEPAP